MNAFDQGRRSFVVFRLGEEEYALPISTVGSIIRWEPATSVPRAPESVLGVINLRGRVIPVVDLGRQFGRAPFEPGPLSRIIVAEGATGGVGVAVDGANEVAAFLEEEIRPVPEGILSPETSRSFTGVVEREGSLVILVDLDQAMPRTETVSAGISNAGEKEGSDV